MNWLTFVSAVCLCFLARSAICNSSVDIILFASGTYLMFLNYRPNLRHPSEHSPEFSLPYSLAFLGQISQLSSGTMGMLRLPLSFSSPSVSLGFDTTYGTLSFLSSAMVSVLTSPDLEILGKVFPYLPLLVWRQEALPCFHVCLSYLWYRPRPRSDQCNLSFAQHRCCTNWVKS